MGFLPSLTASGAPIGSAARRCQLAGSKFSTTPLMQYRDRSAAARRRTRVRGVRRSGCSAPRCASSRSSGRRSCRSPLERRKKLGQPVPLSNLRPAANSAWPQPTQLKVPGRFSCSSAHDPGASVPWPRSTAYCCGVSARRHSSSVFSTGNFMISLAGSAARNPAYSIERRAGSAERTRLREIEHQNLALLDSFNRQMPLVGNRDTVSRGELLSVDANAAARRPAPTRDAVAKRDDCSSDPHRRRRRRRARRC